MDTFSRHQEGLEETLLTKNVSAINPYRYLTVLAIRDLLDIMPLRIADFGCGSINYGFTRRNQKAQSLDSGAEW